jgi:hypothetical protein
MRSLGMSQLKKKMCGAELTEEMGCQWLLRNFWRGATESDAGKWALGRGGVRGRGRGRVLLGGQTCVEEGNC